MLNGFAQELERLLEQGDFAELEALSRRALAADAGDLAAQTALGLACQRQQRLAEALAAGEAALAISRDAERCYRLGDICHDLGRVREALDWLEEAVRLDAGHFLARYTLAVVLQDMGRHGEAIPHYAAVLERQPEHAKALNNLGVALQNSGRSADALAAYRRAVAANPQHSGAVANLSGLLAELGETDEARRVLAPSLVAAAPSALDLRAALLLPVIPESRQQIADARAAMEQALDRLIERPPRLIDPLREIGRTPFYLAWHGLPNRGLVQKLASVYRRACPELLLSVPAPAGGRAGAARIRVGFASFHLYQHSVGRGVAGLIEYLPRDRFEVVVLFLGGMHEDPLAAAIARGADRAVQCGYDLTQAQQTIAELDLDLLCLPDIGIEPLSYFIGCSRLAPIQCTTWGHPDTSGLDSIDYYVSAEGSERASAATDYSERLVRLAGVAAPAFSRRPETRQGQSRLGGGPSVFCPQSLFRLHPDFDPLLARLLGELPTAKLYLIEAPRPEWTQRLHRRLAGALRGDGEQRIVWLPPMSRADYMATLAAADLVLDPPHGADSETALDAFALGTPLVTLPGELMRTRITAGCYRHMGFTELVAGSADDYVALALRLLRDQEFRRHASASIAAAESSLFGGTRVIDEWARFIETAHAAR